MKKKLKLKISAVMLSIVLVLTMVATPSAFTARDVSAEESKDTEVNVSKMNRLEKWALAMGTDIGESATPIGASANVVGIATAAKAGHMIKWGKYCKVMAPATIIVVGISMLMIYARYL